LASKVFHRTALADEMVQSLIGARQFGSTEEGLFLAAPRRTGKTTYLRFDLIPALERRKIAVVYADLWTDLKISPEQRIYEALTAAIMQHSGPVAKAAKKSKLSEATVGAGGSALTFDASRIGESDGPSLTDACKQLAGLASTPVALILDEAQRILESDRGAEVMKELKAARDTLNRPGSPTLVLVFTGSDRDKLSRLNNHKGAAFWGSKVEQMPLLDADYVAWVTGEIVKAYPQLYPVQTARIEEIFRGLGSRPKALNDAIGDALNPIKGGTGSFEDRVSAFAEEQLSKERRAYAESFLALSPIQKAVLTHMMQNEDADTLFGAAALKSYSLIAGKAVAPAAVQNALEALRKKQPSLVWKSNRSEYALEDPGMAAWYRELAAAGHWPPRQGQ
jgi:hypothetical protein